MLNVFDSFHNGLDGFLTLPVDTKAITLTPLFIFAAIFTYSGVSYLRIAKHYEHRKVASRFFGRAMILAGFLVPVACFFYLMLAISSAQEVSHERAEILARKHEECAVSGGAWIRGSDVSPFAQSFCVPGRD